MSKSIFRIALLTSLFALLALPTSQASTTSLRQDEPRPEDLVQKLLKLTNAERERHGQKPLVLEPRLCKAAEWMAKDMADNNYFSHADHRGRMVDERVEEAGYTEWTRVGENIAGGYKTPEGAVQGWMNSPSHKATLLRSEYAEIGFGFFKKEGTRYTYYWVQVFGSK